MAKKPTIIEWEETHGLVDLDNRYSVCAGSLKAPGDVEEWCLTGSLRKAKAAFARIKNRAEFDLITLQDRYTNTTLQRMDRRSG